MTDPTNPVPTTRVSIEFVEGVPVQRVVVPVALDHRYDRGVAAAAPLAERFDLPVLLVSVQLGDGDTVDLARGDLIKELRDAVTAAHPTIDVDDLVMAGSEEPAVTLAASLRPDDLVVLATDAVEGPTGSFAQHLAGHTDAPVMMLGPDAQLGDLSGDVIVGVDGSVLAERCLPAAVGLAAALGSNVKLLEAVSSVVTEHIGRLKRRGERVSENAYIRDLAERLNDASVSWEVVHHDDPAAALSDAAERSGAAIIAMSTHGREGFVSQVFGSITLDTVRQARCPVLVQRPVSEPLTEIGG